MPPRPGENTLCTFFADVHYLISPPGHRPPHHRLEKSSYFYLYHGPSTSPRIEIANNPGTPYQDAFTGSLANASISHKPNQPSLVSFTVNRQAPQGYQDADGAWQLKAHDPTQRTEYMYQLHSVYVYFWTALDAESFVAKVTELGVGGLRQDGVPYQQQHQQQHQQHQSQQQPQPQHQQQQQVQRKSVSSGTGNSATMSPVVQKLEQAAITPTYSPSHQQNASTSTAGVSPIAQPTPVHSSTAPTQQQYEPQGHTSPPPPTGSAGGTSNASAPPPLAYNPAAPAAPEPIAHREKTPPPPDTGSTVAVQDVSSAQGYPYAQQGGFTLQQTYPPHQAHQQIPSYGSSPPPPPPPSGQPQPGSYTSGNNLASQQQGPYQGQAAQLHNSSPPPVSATGGLMTSSSPPPADGTNSLYSAPTPPHSAQNSVHAGTQQAGQQQQPQQQQQYQPQRQPSLPFQQYASSPPPPHQQQQAPYNPQQQAYQSPLQSPSFTPQATATTTHPLTSPPPIQSSPFGQQQQLYNPQTQPQPQPQYQPQQQDQQQQQQTQPTPSQIHSQHYTPTAAETSATGGKPQTATNPGTPGRFEAKTEKLEKGVGRFLKRLDKKF